MSKRSSIKSLPSVKMSVNPIHELEETPIEAYDGHGLDINWPRLVSLEFDDAEDVGNGLSINRNIKSGRDLPGMENLDRDSEGPWTNNFVYLHNVSAGYSLDLDTNETVRSPGETSTAQADTFGVEDNYNYYNYTERDRDLIRLVPSVITKFDALFPFYRLSDKDCKILVRMVCNEINVINRIFCNAQGRFIHVKIYYKGLNKPKMLSFFNTMEPQDEVEKWNDIIMNEKYCLKEIKNNNHLRVTSVF